MAQEIHEGGCVCGALRYRAQSDPVNVVVCHCDWCRRRTGSGFAVIPKFEKAQIEILSGDMTTYRHSSDESDRWLELRFCPKCGTNIGFTQELRPNAYAIDAGTFDDPTWINADRQHFRHIFTRSSPGWSRLPEDAEAYEGHFFTDPKDAGGP